MKKKLCSWLLVLTMALSLLPTAAFAAEEEAASITAYVTISSEGSLVTGKGGEAVAYAPVTVTDQNENDSFDIDDMLYAAHEQYYAGGANAGYSTYDSTYGLSLSKLWGVGEDNKTASAGYYLNHASAWSLTDTVNNGDYVAAFNYRDTAYWSDIYCYFDQLTPVIQVNTSLELKLGYQAWDYSNYPDVSVVDAVVAGAAITANGETMTDVTTNDAGMVTVSFSESGTYLLSATGSDLTLVPPVCQVTVLSEEDYASATLSLAAEELTWSDLSAEPANAVTAAPTLPASVEVGDKTVYISWSCDDGTGALSVYTYGGFTSAYVNRPAAQDVSCTLTAALSYGEQTLTKTFPVTIQAEGVNDEKESVSDYGALMAGIADTYETSTDPWTVLDMAAYGKNIKAADGYSAYASAAPKALAEAAIGGAADLSGLTDFDPNAAYAIYTTPYVLLAYDAAGADDAAFTTQRSDLKAAMVAYLNALETNWADTDDVTPILAALAPYYQRGEDELDSAVTAAIQWLSQKQNADGTFSYYGTANANSTALAVVALSALGIDAHTNADFVKDKSAVEGLFSFALSGKDGFGYKGNVTRNTLATEQGFRALVAYAHFKEDGAAYNIYVLADVEDEAPAAPEITATIPDSPGGDDDDDSDETITVTLTVRTHRTTWISKMRVELEAGESVGDLMYEAANLDEDLTFVDKNGYISSITYAGETWAEFDAGTNSGWKYTVNGAAPEVGMNDRCLEDGDKVVWYYVTDYTEDDTSDEGSTTKPVQPAEVELPFTDTQDHWAEDAIAYCYEKGLMTGTGETTFSPEATTSRAMIVTILYRLEKTPAISGEAPFTDVSGSAYYADAAQWATEQGIVSGYGNGAFGPNDHITREQLALILMNYARYKGYDTKKVGDLSGFADAGEISAWAVEALAWANAEGLVNGRSETAIAPAGTATRGEVATILMRYLDQIAK